MPANRFDRLEPEEPPRPATPVPGAFPAPGTGEAEHGPPPADARRADITLVLDGRAGAAPPDADAGASPEQSASGILRWSIGIGVALLIINRTMNWNILDSDDSIAWRILLHGLAFDLAMFAGWLLKFGWSPLESRPVRTNLGIAALVIPLIVCHVAAAFLNCALDFGPSSAHAVDATYCSYRGDLCVSSWRGHGHINECFRAPGVSCRGIIPKVETQPMIVETKPGFLGYEWVSAYRRKDLAGRGP